MSHVQAKPHLVQSYVVNSRASDGVRDWMASDGVSEQEIVEAVRVVGNSLTRVKAYVIERRRFEEQRSA
jgi:hypothetical protein